MLVRDGGRRGVGVSNALLAPAMRSAMHPPPSSRPLQIPSPAPIEVMENVESSPLALSSDTPPRTPVRLPSPAISSPTPPAILLLLHV
ncbi:hypothetical protein BDQ12DRAFT_404151 [Crucibulum laeve]|uniref:Uncharacterized protein n=1 Tax=Crucibulum laeve TaxID=68775 RepID=A0A5C3LKP8_9AGAR|nr:hypothetical protein BDQ12DRAFT_404151 [Crucibulum laeve]